MHLTIKTWSLLIEVLLFFSPLTLWGQKTELYPNVPSEYHELLDRALARAGDNARELRLALDSVPAAQAEGLAFLISYMPERDLTTLSAAYLLENVEYAYRARNHFPWGATIPKMVFFNDVLPYAILSEKRDHWRKELYEYLAANLKTTRIKELKYATMYVNIFAEKLFEVKYNIARERPDQTPLESMRQKMASCTGLAILLTDAFRAVGIPSRIVGTPNWYDDRGNHNWNEVWLDGTWSMTAYTPSLAGHAWILSSAGRANPSDSAHAIYASSFRPTGCAFPLAWDSTITYVHGINVTQHYVDLFQEKLKEWLADSTYLELQVSHRDSTLLTPDKRVAVNVDVFRDGHQVEGGRTIAGKRSTEEFLTFILRKNTTYQFHYFLPDGTEKRYEYTTGNQNALVELP